MTWFSSGEGRAVEVTWPPEWHPEGVEVFDLSLQAGGPYWI